MPDSNVIPLHPADPPCDTEPSDPVTQAIQLDEIRWRKFLQAMGWEDLEKADDTP